MADHSSYTGKIVKGIGGFYYVHVSGDKVFSCRAKGIFRQLSIKPLVGDNVTVDVISEDKLEGNLSSIHERKNVLIRPAVSNIDQALVVFAVREPDPNLNLLDRFLINMDRQSINTVIFFNKNDIDTKGEGQKLREIYEKAGYTVILGSTKNEATVKRISELLKGKTTVLAGPSGVGKSSLTNRIYLDAGMEIGELSEKIKRGKQTTRHTELFAVDDESFILDTPGFTSLFVEDIDPTDLRYYYNEFSPYHENCRFPGCSHVNEPDRICSVKNAVNEGHISRERYDNYCRIYKELESAKNKY